MPKRMNYSHNIKYVSALAQGVDKQKKWIGIIHLITESVTI